MSLPVMSLHLLYDTIKHVCFCTLKNFNTVQFLREAGNKVRGLRLENQFYKGWYGCVLKIRGRPRHFLPR